MKFTHQGKIVACSSAALGNPYTTKLRETKNWWVTERGTKYYKRTGWPVGVTWAHWKLELESISPIP